MRNKLANELKPEKFYPIHVSFAKYLIVISHTIKIIISPKFIRQIVAAEGADRHGGSEARVREQRQNNLLNKSKLKTFFDLV